MTTTLVNTPAEFENWLKAGNGPCVYCTGNLGDAWEIRDLAKAVYAAAVEQVAIADIPDTHYRVPERRRSFSRWRSILCPRLRNSLAIVRAKSATADSSPGARSGTWPARRSNASCGWICLASTPSKLRRNALKISWARSLMSHPLARAGVHPGAWADAPV